MFVQFDFLAQIIKIYIFFLKFIMKPDEAMKSKSLGVVFELKNLIGKLCL
jgi:hypothetical protein